MRTHGAEKLAFGLIVGFGANGAMSHAVPSDRVLQRGEPIVIDMGCKVDGYCSDMTRTFCVGHPVDPVKFHEVWNVVLEAQQQACAVIKAGMIGKDAHAIAQQVIEKAGYGDKFGHGLGHGGMGAVYKARQKKLDRVVALKIVRPDNTDDPTFTVRFNREARTLARLNHPSIVGVYDFGDVDFVDEHGKSSKL